MRGIRQLDTVKDGAGNLFLVSMVRSDGYGHIVARLQRVRENGKAMRGHYRIVSVPELMANYMLADTEQE